MLYAKFQKFHQQTQQHNYEYNSILMLSNILWATKLQLASGYPAV